MTPNRELIAEFKRRWMAAAHAVQSGVKCYIEMVDDYDGASPKHLRTGVNVALRDQGSLVDLLIQKGVISEVEYMRAIAEGMEKEAKGLEEEISKKLGRQVRLG